MAKQEFFILQIERDVVVIVVARPFPQATEVRFLIGLSILFFIFAGSRMTYNGKRNEHLHVSRNTSEETSGDGIGRGAFFNVRNKSVHGLYIYIYTHTFCTYLTATN